MFGGTARRSTCFVVHGNKYPFEIAPVARWVLFFCQNMRYDERKERGKLYGLLG
nr:MAG TPA: hypothetical protein [Caudoviricetes sp.]